MFWQDLLRALALMLVLEGLMPFIAPERWREVLLRVAGSDPRMLRLFGGALLIGGLILLQFLRP
ncbi:MAG: DUF2065 domain-containing protein [Nevskiales bacterium]